MITRSGGLSEKAAGHSFEGRYATSALLADEEAKKENIAMVCTHAQLCSLYHHSFNTLSQHKAQFE